mgnify:CR=1 FL=1
MNNLPEVIIRRIEKATEKGVDIKIDTIISNNGERKENIPSLQQDFANDVLKNCAPSRARAFPKYVFFGC